MFTCYILGRFHFALGKQIGNTLEEVTTLLTALDVGAVGGI